MAGSGLIKYTSDSNGEAIQHVTIEGVTGSISSNVNITGSSVLPVSGTLGIFSTTTIPSFIRTTTSGTIAAGAKGIKITNTSGSVGTVSGSNLKVSESVDFQPPAGYTLGSLSYNATGTEFTIVTMV
jgi:hypothetical protein